MNFTRNTNLFFKMLFLGTALTIVVFSLTKSAWAKAPNSGWYYNKATLELLKTTPLTAHQLNSENLLAVHWQKNTVQILGGEININCESEFTNIKKKFLLSLNCGENKRYASWTQDTKRLATTNLFAALLGRKSHDEIRLIRGPDLNQLISKLDELQKNEILSRFFGTYQNHESTIHLTSDGNWIENNDNTPIKTFSCTLKISSKKTAPAFCILVNNQYRSNAFVFWESSTGQKLKTITVEETPFPSRPIANLEKNFDSVGFQKATVSEQTPNE